MSNYKFLGSKIENLTFIALRHNLLTINVDVFYVVYYNIYCGI